MSAKLLHRPDHTRSRTRNFVQTFTGRYRNKLLDTSTGVVTYDYDTPRVTLVTQVDEMTDVVSPGYAQRIAAGEVISHPLSGRKSVYSASTTGFQLRITSGTSQQTWTEDTMFPNIGGQCAHLPHGINVDNLIHSAQTKCLSNVKTSSFMGIVAVAEGGKTLRMLLQPLSAVAPLLAYVSQLRKGNVNISIRNRGNTLVVNGRSFPRYSSPGTWKGPGRLVKPPKGNIVVPAGAAISGAVLANNLGLRPLMMDLQALLNDIPKAHTNERLTFRSNVQDQSTKTSNTVLGSSWGSAPCTTTTETTVEVRCTALVLDRFHIPSDFGVSVDDIPEAAWELIPYSFVVDYFVNVGDMLAAARALRQYDFLSFSTVTTTTQDTVRAITGFTPASPYVALRAASGSDSLSSVTKNRTVGVPNPWFAYTPPSQVAKATVVQNLLSLFVQQLSGMNSGAKRTFF